MLIDYIELVSTVIARLLTLCTGQLEFWIDRRFAVTKVLNGRERCTVELVQLYMRIMSDAGASRKSSCSVQTSSDIRERPLLKTPRTNKLMFENVCIDSPVSELAKDLGELSTST